MTDTVDIGEAMVDRDGRIVSVEVVVTRGSGEVEMFVCLT